jgi:hypothetical protein
MATLGYDLKWKCHVHDVFAEVKNLRAEDNFSDVIVHCGGRNFLAHKVILAASSRFFERVFASAPRDRSQVLVMAETRADLLELLMSFIYEGQAYVPAADLDDFIAVAEKLEIRGLNSGAGDQSVSSPASGDQRKAAGKRPVPTTPSTADHESEDVPDAQVSKRPRTALESVDEQRDASKHRSAYFANVRTSFLLGTAFFSFKR